MRRRFLLRKTYEQATIQFDDKVDVVFELQPTQPARSICGTGETAEDPKPHSNPVARPSRRVFSVTICKIESATKSLFPE